MLPLTQSSSSRIDFHVGFASLLVVSFAGWMMHSLRLHQVDPVTPCNRAGK